VVVLVDPVIANQQGKLVTAGGLLVVVVVVVLPPL
jgi:hypothetical protein